MDAQEILHSVNSVQDDKTMEEENKTSASSASKKLENPRHPRAILREKRNGTGGGVRMAQATDRGDLFSRGGLKARDSRGGTERGSALG
ncbi:MAG: hypothetical protein IJ013_05095 [Bacteroidaceae bacterium]|nr:hypothetical protein [Bacteroidaceae bacterium]